MNYQLFSDADKRKCSVNTSFRPESEQPYIAVIFRGQRKMISQLEKQTLDKDLDLYFHCIVHIEKTLEPFVEKESRFVLFCNSLTC